MPARLRLAICHGSRLFCECLCTALRSIEEYEVITMSDPRHSEPSVSADGRAEVVLIDAGMSNSTAFQMVRKLGESDERPRTILMISAGAPDLIESCLKAGADGCVLDDDTLSDLCLAIETVRSGRSFCSPQLAHMLFTRADGYVPAAQAVRDAREQRLTRREIEILRLISQRDLSNKQIARELCLSVYTVKNHVHSIIEKLSVENRQTAVRHALQLGLLSDRAS